MVVSSSGTTVRNGAMHDNHAYGFDNGDTFSPDTLLEDCEVFDNLGTQGGGAINAYAGSSGFTVRRTHLHDNVNAAVQIGWSGGWLLEDSTLEGNAHGLILDSANSGTCRGNEISDNTGYGVALAGWGTMNNLFTANAIRGNDQGCRVSGPNANANTFRENTIAANAVGVAVTLNASGDNSGNLFYRNNFAGNTLQATDASLGGNAWDNGLPDGGNWWSDWTAPDADHDGFVDAAYVFTGGQDDYPFAERLPDDHRPRRLRHHPGGRRRRRLRRRRRRRRRHLPRTRDHRQAADARGRRRRRHRHRRLRLRPRAHGLRRRRHGA